MDIDRLPVYSNGVDYSYPDQGYDPQSNYYNYPYSTDDSITAPVTKTQVRSGVKWLIVLMFLFTFVVAVVALVLGGIAFARSNDDCSSGSSSSSSSNPSYRYSSVINVPLTPVGPISGPPSLDFKPDTLVVLTGASLILDSLVVNLPSNPKVGDTMNLVNYSDVPVTVMGDGTHAAILDFNQTNAVTLPAQESISFTISKNNGTGVQYWFIPS